MLRIRWLGFTSWYSHFLCPSVEYGGLHPSLPDFTFIGIKWCNIGRNSQLSSRHRVEAQWVFFLKEKLQECICLLSPPHSCKHPTWCRGRTDAVSLGYLPVSLGYQYTCGGLSGQKAKGRKIICHKVVSETRIWVHLSFFVAWFSNPNYIELWGQEEEQFHN